MVALNKLKIAVFGAGSIGCYLGGYLQSAGAPVTFIGRERVKWDLDLKGLILTHYRRPSIELARSNVHYSLNPADMAQADVILVCVKSQDTAQAADLILEHVSPQALIVSFQNGIGNADLIARMTGRKALAAIVPFNVTPVRRGELHCGTEGDLIIQQDNDPGLAALIKGFRKSKMGAKTVSRIADYQWGKLLVNLNNALSALSGGTLRAGLSQKAYRAVLADMMEEGLSVCKTAGISPKNFGKTSIARTIKILRLPNMMFDPVMNAILKIDESARSSMLDDLEGGKGSEVDYLQGAIVDLAASTGQSAPINQIILNEVHRAFQNAHSPLMSGADMQALIEDL